jgi:hypothetical protein
MSSFFRWKFPSREESNMKPLLVAALVVTVALTAGTLAFAEDKEGTIKMIQVDQRVITLSDGTQMHWVESYRVPADIKEGAKVKVNAPAACAQTQEAAITDARDRKPPTRGAARIAHDPGVFSWRA